MPNVPPGDDTDYTCATCSATVGMFIGREGWHHFRGAGTVASPVELYDPGHPAAPMLGSSNGQAGHAELVRSWRDASARLRRAGTAAYDVADAVLTTGARPGHAEAIYAVADDLRQLSRELAILERQQRDNREEAPDQ